ncbi:hypothetical protein GPL21_34740 [Bradyrhizobium pachyrhizi]|uniref:Uncharacterized protein n=1 Tax=Bradyrhizobium pachyrhizi TaxID=280333 RepID=A0A844T6I3_9BRAD|nr:MULTISPECIES: hypothetical protein [Bradyrhizobium]MVT70240.1 hypothetical protein [Bradyrhizobium pachyrhizi]
MTTGLVVYQPQMPILVVTFRSSSGQRRVATSSIRLESICAVSSGSAMAGIPGAIAIALAPTDDFRS